MAKRNKNLAKSRKSALRVEALEQRQLLAAVTGGGTEVGTDIHHANGNVFDQVLATGASVTVTADAGQITRVSFLDLNGDIVQAEFSGAGTLNVAFDPASLQTNVAPAGYNQDVKYVQGLASFTIQGSDASTNFQVFSVGKGNAVNQSLFDATHNGGNGLADIARLLVVANPLNPQGSTMGSIRAANAIFADSTGAVGIAAANVQVQNTVIVGDIIASNSAIPTLNFGINSQFGVVQVAGGSLQSPNGTAIQDNSNTLNGPGNYAYGLNFVDGTKSSYVQGSDKTDANGYIKAKVFDGALVNFNVGGHLAMTLDTATEIDITGKTQAELNTIFNGRTFLNDVKITGVLDSGFNIKAAAFRGNVEFVNEVKGDITLTDANGVTQPVAAFGKTLTFDDKVAAVNIQAESFADIVAKKDFAANVISTDGNAASTLDGKVGNLTFGGNYSGSVAAAWSIGNVTVAGNVTGAGTKFATAGNSATQIGNVGTLTVEGDVRLAAAGNNLINIAGIGTFGDVTIKGAGALGKNNDANNIGVIAVNALGAGQNKTGSVSITEGNAVDINFGGVTLGGGTGSIGAITVTGGDAVKTDLTVGAIGGAGVTVGDITISKFNDVALAGAVTGSVGAVSVSTIAGTDADNSSITLGGGFAAGTGSIKSVTLDAGADKSAVTINADIAAKTIGDVVVKGKAIALAAGKGIVANADGASVGAITFTGDTTVARVAADANLDLRAAGAILFDGKLTTAGVAGEAIKAVGTVDSITSTGTTVLSTGDNINTVGGSVTNAIAFKNLTVAAGTAVKVASIGALTLNGTTDLSLNAGATFQAHNDAAALDTIGAVNINGTIKGGAGDYDITASSVGNVTITGALLENSSLVESFGINVANNAGSAANKAETVARDGSNLSSYKIGNITVNNTNTIGLTGTSIFAGTNRFDALGGIGDIAITGGGSAAVQTQLFAAGGAVDFVAGSRTGSVDLDGSGAIGNVGANTGLWDNTVDNKVDLQNAEAKADFTGGTVSIGNVTLNVARVAPTAAEPNNNDSILAVNGLTILSGVRKTAAAGVAADYTNIDAGNSTGDVGTIGSLKGDIGNILVTNANQQLSRAEYITKGGTVTEAPASVALAATVTPLAGAEIVASGKTGTIQGAANSQLTGAGDYTIIGQEAANKTALGATSDETVVADELIVFVV